MTKTLVLEVHNSCQNGSRHSEVVEHVGLQNHMPYGFNITQKSVAYLGNFKMNSQFPKTVSKGKTVGDLDLNFMNPNANNLEKQNNNFDYKSFRRASFEFPLVRKHRDFDLNEKPSASIDFHFSNSILAMELLSFMDVGMQPSLTFSLDEKPKFFTNNFFPYDHHPKVGLDETSKILEKPLFPYIYHVKEFSSRGSGVFNDSSRHLSFEFYGKNHPLNKPYECSHVVPVPVVGSFPSLLQNNGNFKTGTSKFEKRGKTLMESTSGISCINHEFNSIQDMQKGFNGTSDTMVFPLQCHTIENARKCIDMEAGCMNATIFPMRIIFDNEICSINRNPADFIIPEEGNEYMISDQDLKFKNKISSSEI
ncbi:Protein EMBRYONIC FLOWER 1 [Camellia lanceoleosa]|uniref:Protein EMBRYONIC FLOWER 1 n=1 Tax=Camellia lanceoleosa TaxID=1840588 RepID=A0ACC0G4G8_9ERIC|nr:Protein EMBRYONIC FLOWER 1 [Camellia lanceoleosa]